MVFPTGCGYAATAGGGSHPGTVLDIRSPGAGARDPGMVSPGDYGEADQDRAKVMSHAKAFTFQLAEVAVPRAPFAAILGRIGRQGAVPPFSLSETFSPNLDQASPDGGIASSR